MSTVAMLAYHDMVLSAVAGGSERSFREDVQLLTEAGHHVETWGSTALAGARSARHHLLPPAPGRAARATAYVGAYLRASRGAVRLVYNEPLVAGLTGRGTILRHAWLAPTPSYLRLPGLARNFAAATHLFPSAGALMAADGVVSPNRIVVPNAVDLDHFVPASTPRRAGPFRVGFAGRWAIVKGLDVLLNAWPTVRAEVAEAELHLAGGPGVWPSVPEERRLSERVASMHASGVIDVGLLDRSALPPFWHAMSVTVLPSTCVECFGNTILEAMACGVPAVVSASGGLPGLVGDTGRVVPVGDAPALARALIDAAADGQDAAVRARQRAMTYGPEPRRHALDALVRSLDPSA